MSCVRGGLGMAAVALGVVVAGCLFAGCVDFEGRTHGPRVKASPSGTTATPIFGQGANGGGGGSSDSGPGGDAGSCGDDCGCLAQCCDALGPPIGNGDACSVPRDRWSTAWCARALADYQSRSWCD